MNDSRFMNDVILKEKTMLHQVLSLSLSLSLTCIILTASFRELTLSTFSTNHLTASMAMKHPPFRPDCCPRKSIPSLGGEGGREGRGERGEEGGGGRSKFARWYLPEHHELKVKALLM